MDSAKTTPRLVLLISGITSNLYPIPSIAPRSRQASSLPHGFQVLLPGRKISHEPGFDRLTMSEPGDATNGVTIDAAATGEPDKSWIVIDQPFLSFNGLSLSLSLPNEVSHPLPLPCSDFSDL